MLERGKQREKQVQEKEETCKAVKLQRCKVHVRGKGHRRQKAREKKAGDRESTHERPKTLQNKSVSESNYTE